MPDDSVWFSSAGASLDVANTAPSDRSGAGARDGLAHFAGATWARSYFPALEYDEQVDLMQQLAEGVAPHV